MAQEIRTQPSVFGRIGEGLGQGLAESIPREVERSRLASGLQQLEGQQGLSPFQQFSRLASIPGVIERPQLLQSAADLLRQQGMLQGLQQSGFNIPKQPSFSDIRPGTPTSGQSNQDPRSITSVEGIEATRKPYIPMTTPQKDQLALQLHQQNPGLYPDLQTARTAANQIDAENQAINTALQGQRSGEQDIQSTLKNELTERAKTLGADSGISIPGNVLGDIQDQAIDELTKGKLTEKEIAAKYGKMMDNIMREYADARSVGKWSITGRPKNTLDTLNRLQKKFEARRDTRNFADTMVAENAISPLLAYSIAEPVRRDPRLSSAIKSLPNLQKIETIFETVTPNQIEKTQNITPKLAQLIGEIGEKASPLAVAYELKKKGYDPQTFLNYLSQKSEKLNLRQNQLDQLTKKINEFDPLNDMWLSTWGSWTGLEE